MLKERADCCASEVACSGSRIYCANNIITITPNGRLFQSGAIDVVIWI